MLNKALYALEDENEVLRGVLKHINFNQEVNNKPKVKNSDLKDLIDHFNRPQFVLVNDNFEFPDLLGAAYEYLIKFFADSAGKKGGQFYTPQGVVRLLVEMLAPYKGRIYDPCCGSGGMFVQSEKFVEAHGGKLGDISIYGQESNATTRRLAMMNLAIRGIEADLGEEQADTFRRDLHPDLRADFVLANPPFNDSDWFRKDDDARWQFGLPPRGNANFAWVQHFIYHLAPTGMAGFVLANGSMSSNQSGEGEIRRAIIEADLVDCMVALPGQLFYSTQIPVCLWFFRKNKAAGANGNQSGPASRWRDRRRQTLFIDARKLGHLVDRVHRELSHEETQRVAQTYHAWRGTDDPLRNPHSEIREYADVPGFCKSTTTDEIAQHSYVLTPGRYVGAEEAEEEGEPFEEKMTRLVSELNAQFAESAKLEQQIKTNLNHLFV